MIGSEPLFWALAEYDITITLRFSEEPEDDPNTPFNWDEFIDKYKYWVLGGFVGLTLVYMSKKPSIIIASRGK